MRRVGVYIGLLILSLVFPAAGLSGSIGIKSSHGFGVHYGSSRHGHHEKHIGSRHRDKHFVKHRHPKRWSSRLIKYYYPSLGVWTQGYNGRRNNTIEQINIIISPSPQLDSTKRPSVRKQPPAPHMETIDGDDNASNLHEKAETGTGLQ